jgi:predicted nucleic acid-binding protein
VIYLDTCAALKLTRVAPHTEELVPWLAALQGTSLVSSALIEVELERALRRNEPAALPLIPSVLRRITRIEIDQDIRKTAAAYPDPLLRSLDAIHLATAQTIHSAPGEGITHFVTYDKRLITAARASGLPVAHPGAKY